MLLSALSVCFSKVLCYLIMAIYKQRRMCCYIPRCLEMFQIKQYWILLLAINVMLHTAAEGMFKRLNWLDDYDTAQRNYGVAISDVDGDSSSDFEWIVAGFTGPNFVFKFNSSTKKLDNIAKIDSPFQNLRDEKGRAIGVCACDIDGDGREEIYFLNTNQAYAGRSSYGDKLFKWRTGKYEDLFSDPSNNKLEAKNFAGRSVACIDRYGTGRYSIIVATYSQDGTGNFALIEMDSSDPRNNVEAGTIVLKNVATEAGIEKATGGRAIVVGPILGSDGRSDIFFNNEGNPWLKNPGSNYLFKNLGNGSFIDLATQVGLQDEKENGRGAFLSDFNKDGKLDIVYGNWEGNHRIYLQRDNDGKVSFENVVTSEFETPSLIRTVLTADFDNDGQLEIFMNNIAEKNNLQPNRLFNVKSFGTTWLPHVEQVPVGDAFESDRCGTGAAITDSDGDGRLELLISHGEDLAQPLEIYRVSSTNGIKNNWIRVLPKTKYNAPARGAKVSVMNYDGETQTHIIDGGSGYLCQMEPVAHFGLSDIFAVRLTVQWPDGQTITRKLSETDSNKVHIINHPDAGPSKNINISAKKHNVSIQGNKTVQHEEL